MNGKVWHCYPNRACYHYKHGFGITKPEADEYCSQLGAHVLALETAEETADVIDMLHQYGRCDKIACMYITV